MRILQLCKKFPYPINDGEVIAITNLARALDELGAEIHLLCINTPKHFYDEKEMPDALNFYHSIHTVFVDTDLKPHRAVLNLFSKKSYHIDRFVSDDFSKKLIKLLGTLNPDFVQMETLFLAPYLSDIRNHSTAKVLMRAHNVEHEIWSRITHNTNAFIKKKYLAYLTRKLKNFEVNHLNRYDLLLPITSRDLETFKQLGFNGAAEVIPIGIDINGYHPQPIDTNSPLSISFIGSLDWLPNLEGLNWFLTNCWPKIIDKHPDITLHLAGRNTPASLHELGYKNLIIHGEVADAKAFINAHPVMIVPLLSGSGMRVKILEGMALGREVITTKIGLEGIVAVDKKEVLIADTIEGWLGAIDFCLEERARLDGIGNAAREVIVKGYGNLGIGRRLWDGLVMGGR